MSKEILTELKNTTDDLLRILDILSPNELNRIPFEGSWTAGQVGDHLLKSYGVVETLNGEVKSTNRAPDQKVAGIKAAFLNFNNKMQSPDFIIPTNDVINKEALLNALKHQISLLVSCAKTQDLSLTCLSFSIPELGNMTRLEWIYFVMYHTQRHNRQLKNIVGLLGLDKQL